MKLFRIVLTVVFVILICVGIVWLFIYKTTSDNPNITFNESKPNQTATSTATTTDEAQPATDNHNPLDDCIELKANEAKDKDFQKGELLVVFENGISLQTAIESIQFYKLAVVESPDAQSNFNQYRWLTVKVPKDEEFKWQCLLETGEGIKRTILNTMFNLHQ